MKLKACKLANAVACGNGNASYFTDDQFEMTLDGITIRIKSRRPSTGGAFNDVCTSLFNCIYWVELKEVNVAGLSDSAPSISRAIQKKSKTA